MLARLRRRYRTGGVPMIGVRLLQPVDLPRTHWLLAGVSRQVHPVALPDAFLDAGALPTLHDRYGLSTDHVVAKVLDLL